MQIYVENRDNINILKSAETKRYLSSRRHARWVVRDLGVRSRAPGGTPSPSGFTHGV